MLFALVAAIVFAQAAPASAPMAPAAATPPRACLALVESMIPVGAGS